MQKVVQMIFKIVVVLLLCIIISQLTEIKKQGGTECTKEIVKSIKTQQHQKQSAPYLKKKDRCTPWCTLSKMCATLQGLKWLEGLNFSIRNQEGGTNES